jgi:hypothetical protein
MISATVCIASSLTVRNIDQFLTCCKDLRPFYIYFGVKVIGRRDDLAAGRVPDSTALLVGAQALARLSASAPADRDLLDAAHGLKMLATGGTLELDEAGRVRAKTLAARLRKLSDHS